MSLYVKKDKYKKLIVLIVLYLCILLLTSCSITKSSIKLGENKVIEEVLSPNGKYKISLFERNVGATADYSYHISIFKQDYELRNSDVGNVFISSDVAESSWINDNKIIIKFSEHNKTFKQIYELDEIEIEYLSK